MLGAMVVYTSDNFDWCYNGGQHQRRISKKRMGQLDLDVLSCICTLRSQSYLTYFIWIMLCTVHTVCVLCYLRCTQCSEFTRRVRQVSLQDERAALERAQSLHIKNVRMYRHTQSRLNTLSEISTAGQGGNVSILKLDIDGLDQAKTRYPRLNSINPKSLSGAWRPQIHLLGCIIWGVPCKKINFMSSHYHDLLLCLTSHVVLDHIGFEFHYILNLTSFH